MSVGDASSLIKTILSCFKLIFKLCYPYLAAIVFKYSLNLLVQSLSTKNLNMAPASFRITVIFFGNSGS